MRKRAQLARTSISEANSIPVELMSRDWIAFFRNARKPLWLSRTLSPSAAWRTIRVSIGVPTNRWRNGMLRLVALDILFPTTRSASPDVIGASMRPSAPIS